MTPRLDVASARSPVWTRDLGAQARRLFALFGGPSRPSQSDRSRRDDDDDDDLPRPNAVLLPFFGPRPAAMA